MASHHILFPYIYAAADISEANEGGYRAIIPKFPKLFIYADTPEELNEEVRENVLSEIELYRQEGIPIPDPDFAKPVSFQPPSMYINSSQKSPAPQPVFQ